MRHLFLALFLLCAIHSAHAAPLPTLDMDELLFSSDEVLEGYLVAAYSPHPKREAFIHVEKTWIGRYPSGSTIGVNTVELYSKNLSVERRGSLEKGDRVIFFLRNTRAHPSESYFQRGAGLQVLFSGVRLIRANRVSGFTQNSNPGGYDELPSVSRAVFDAGFAASRARIADLKTHLRAPVRVQDKPYFMRWKALRMQRLPRGEYRFFGDAISQAVAERLHQIALLKPRPTPIP